jgi:hypothetical protein
MPWSPKILMAMVSLISTQLANEFDLATIRVLEAPTKIPHHLMAAPVWHRIINSTNHEYQPGEVKLHLLAVVARPARRPPKP